MNAKRTKIMNNEIKVGDKVRVSKDTPKLLFTRSICNYPEYVFEVRVIEDDLADIYYGAGKIPLAAFVVPTKYLIKVDAEAKEPKFKVGDVVRMKDGYYKEELCGCIGVIRKIDGCHIYVEIDSTIYLATTHSIEPYTEPTAPTIKVGDFVRVLENLHEPICLEGDLHLEIANVPPHAVSQKEWKVISVEMRRDCAGRIYTLKHDDSFIYNIPEDCVELVQPTEQTEAEETDIDNIVDDFAKVMEGYRKVFADIADNFDWQHYEADLAKEVAVKLSKPNENKPGYVAEYAVSVAKAVVENLKKK